MSDATLIHRTGKTRGEWHALLDAENAVTWTHTEIARWLHEHHHVHAWWAQGVTVGYEQARGMRLPGQKADGTFAVGSSKTIPGSLEVVLDRIVAAFSEEFGAEPASISRSAKHPTARWARPDGTNVLATLSPGGIGETGRVRVAMTRMKMTDPDALEQAKAELAAVLERLAG